MTGKLAVGTSRLWSLSWVIIIRLILYLVVIGFFVQYIYFGEKGQFYRPGQAILAMVGAFFLSLIILAIGVGRRHLDRYIALTYILDLLVLTLIIIASGGFNSVFIPYYLPVLVMATAWLPRHYTAVFPSIATLGVAYVGLAHIMLSLGETDLFSFIYPDGIQYTLRFAQPHTIVSNMLILAVLFFVISYLSGMLSDKLFVEQRLNAKILSNMQEGVAVVAAGGELVFANAEFLRIFPMAQGTASFTNVAAALFKGTDELSLERLLAGGANDSIILTREEGAGLPPLDVRISGISFRGKKELYGLVFLILDLTTRKRMEEAEKSLDRFSAISTMAAGLAHEIRNPLASLRSAIQEIGDAFPPESQNRVLTDVVISESDRLDGVISRFLDFSREGHLRPAKTRLSGMLGEIMTMFMHDPQANKVELVLDIHDDPQVLCDPGRIKEVFLNLSLNAIQALPERGGRLDIVLEQRNRGYTPGIEILFLDNGPGIPAENLPRLFEPFFSSKPKGTGMGLALSRKQVGMHEGELEASNRPEGGACFRVWLPLEPVGEAKTRTSGTRIFTPEWRRRLPKQEKP